MESLHSLLCGGERTQGDGKFNRLGVRELAMIPATLLNKNFSCVYIYIKYEKNHRIYVYIAHRI